VPTVLRKAGAGRTITLTFKLDRRLAAIRHALAARHRVTLRVSLTATDAAGNAAHRHTTIVLRR
jgi:hypothetical protein